MAAERKLAIVTGASTGIGLELDLDARLERSSYSPGHFRLALPNADATAPDRHPQHRYRLVATTGLGGIRKSGFVDVDPRIERLDRNDEVDELKPRRYLTAQVEQAVTWLAGQRYQENDGIHR